MRTIPITSNHLEFSEYELSNTEHGIVYGTDILVAEAPFDCNVTQGKKTFKLKEGQKIFQLMNGEVYVEEEKAKKAVKKQEPKAKKKVVVEKVHG